MKKIFLLFAIHYSLFTIPLSAQTLPHSVGNLKSIKKIANGIALQTDYGNMKVTVYSSNVIRIGVTQNSTFNDFSYATVATPDAKGNYTMKEGAGDITITTDSVKLVITKKPVRVSLYNYKNQLVCADDASFGTEWLGSDITSYKKLFPDEKFIGLGEKTGDLNRRGNGYVNWNTDIPGYETRQDPLYASIPFYIGIHDSLVYGIFLDNSSKSYFNFGAGQERYASFSVADGDMNYFMIWHSNVAKVIESYTWLTGRMPMPPLWSLGYSQCRWSYFPESEMMTLAKNFRDRKIPCDVLWFDIHYMQDYKVFTWSKERYPDPKGMLTKMDQMGFRNVAIIDPGIKVEKGYAAYEDGLKKDMFLKYPDGDVWSGQVWPGWCVFTDYTKPDARIWWGNLFKEDIEAGLDGFWIDMNEPASWGGGKNPENLLFNYEGKTATYKTGKNIYALEMARATYEGTKQLFDNKRPFVLTRAGFAGLQRYSAIWTGDNVAEENHMLLGVRLINSLGLSGVPFAGVDVGGFVGNGNAKLMSRWISIGAFSPFFRSHKEYNGNDSEPWAFGEDAENICRNYIQLHYNLLPYIYSSFYEATQTGMPVQRSLSIDYTMDEKIYWGNTVNEYMFGPSILVVPQLATQLMVPAYLPHGTWYDFYSDEKLEGGTSYYRDAPVQKLPVFVKGGSFVFMQSPVQTTAEKPADTLAIHIYYSASQHAQVYYEDSGNGFDYLQGNFFKREMKFDGSANKIVMEKTEGNYRSHFTQLKIYFHGFPKVESVRVNGKAMAVKPEAVTFISGIDKADPLADRSKLSATIATITISNSTDQMEIGW